LSLNPLKQLILLKGRMQRYIQAQQTSAPRSIGEFPAAVLFFFALAFSDEVIGAPVGALIAAVLIPLLIGTVFAAVQHAERRHVGAARNFRT
jgi:hypothetical protein